MKSIPFNETPILIADDDDGLLLSIKTTLISSGMPEPALVSDSAVVMELIRSHHYQLILLDLIMPGLNGMEILQQLKDEFPDTECIIVTAVDDVSSAVRAMRFGAYDYLVKPIQSEKLIITINRALERYNLRKKLALYEKDQSFSDLKNPLAFRDMIAEDRATALVFHQAEAAAPTDYNILITGESGTGKELLASIIHGLSHRSHKPFLAVNMAAFSAALFDDEFFGHTKGAYTGALRPKEGFFEAAQGGTLFLDEITELDISLQGKLLRVIQEREIYRLGSTEARDVDVRIIASTNRDIQEEIGLGRFRADLFYRLNMCHINIPPLRERKNDILPVAQHFLKKHASKNKKPITSLAPDLSERLLKYPFPGNVRELENIIASGLLLETGDTMTLSVAPGLEPFSSPEISGNEELLPMAEIEKRHIHRVMEATKGNRTQAANILEIGLRTLQRKLKTLDFSVTMPN